MIGPKTPAAEAEILAPDHPGAQSEQARAAQGTAFAIATRLARTHPVPAALLALLDGPLGTAVAHAGEYAGDSLVPATQRAYERDWDIFAAWCQAQGTDPASLPIHPVLTAAYLGSLSGHDDHRLLHPSRRDFRSELLDHRCKRITCLELRFGCDA